MSSPLTALRSLVQPLVDRASAPQASTTPTAPQSSTAVRDTFTQASAQPASARLLGFGLPDIDLPIPDIDIPVPDIDLPDVDLPDLPDIDLPSLDEIRENFGSFLDSVKDEIIEHGADALFAAIEALPGDVSNEELRRLQDIGQVSAPERGLTGEERAALEEVYGDSIDYDEVVVREGDIGLFNRDDRPLVLGNTILVPEGRLDDDGQISPEDLIHEAAHVWQFQHGGIDYIKESLVDQGQEGSGAYEFEEDVLAGTPWNELGPEQQAHLIESAYEQGYFDGTGNTFEINGEDATAYLEEALRQIRNGGGAPGGPPLVS